MSKLAELLPQMGLDDVAHFRRSTDVKMRRLEVQSSANLVRTSAVSKYVSNYVVQREYKLPLDAYLHDLDADDWQRDDGAGD